MRSKDINFYSCDDMPDAEFINVVNEFSSISNLTQRVHFIYRHFPHTLDGLLVPVVRKIKGTGYKFGNRIDSVHDAEKIANRIVDTLAHDWIYAMEDEVEKRLESSVTRENMLVLIEEEIKYIHEKVKKYETSFKGYTSERRSVSAFEFPDGTNWIESLPNDQLNTGVIILTAYGFSNSLLEKRLMLWKNMIENNQPLPFQIRIYQQKLPEGRGGGDYFSTQTVDKIFESTTSIKGKIIQRPTKQQLEIMILWRDGEKQVGIAKKLSISTSTVKNRISELKNKYGAMSKKSLLDFFDKHNLWTPNETIEKKPA